MKNILLFGDLHISKESLKEGELILNEIINISNENSIDTVIDLGDTFDFLKPSSQELDLFASFINRLNKKIIIIAADSHESEDYINSILNHFGVLNEMVTVVKEFKDENRLYCGHFSIKESNKNYGAILSKNDLKFYVQVWLGHIHSYQVIKPNVCHLGSSRYVNFDEVNDKKVVGLIQNYKEKDEKTSFLALSSPFPMKVVSVATLDPNVQPKQPGVKSPEEITGYLDLLDPKTKVKVKILDFVAYKNFLTLCSKKTYKEKFSKFVIETDFELINSVNKQDSKLDEIDLKTSFETFCQEKQVDKEIQEIIKKELK